MLQCRYKEQAMGPLWDTFPFDIHILTLGSQNLDFSGARSRLRGMSSSRVPRLSRWTWTCGSSPSYGPSPSG